MFFKQNMLFIIFSVLQEISLSIPSLICLNFLEILLISWKKYLFFYQNLFSCHNLLPFLQDIHIFIAIYLNPLFYFNLTLENKWNKNKNQRISQINIFSFKKISICYVVAEHKNKIKVIWHVLSQLSDSYLK